MQTDQLANLIDQKHQTLVQLLDLARRQAALTTDGEINPLLSVLAAKQRLINQLLAVEKELDPFRQEDPESRTWRSGEQRARCAQAAEECRQMLAELMSLERDAVSTLSARRDQAAVRLQTAAGAATARTAYIAKSLHRGASYLDLTSDS